ncbi:hypothetical protein N9301_09550 [Paracoccaceae bacterium]|nr:hypothetical protein [Paracoccaceae bacterium]
MIFSGPMLLKSLIKTYSNSQLIASNITVTPGLDIKIGRLEFALKDLDGQIYRKGFSRSIDVSWAIFNDQPLLHAEIGPTFVENLFMIDYLNVRLPALSEIDFQNILLNGEIRNLEIQTVANSESLSLEAVYNRKRDLLSEVLVGIPSASLTAHQTWDLGGVTAIINEINLTKPIDKQIIKLAVSADNIENKQQDIQMFDSTGLLTFAGGETNFKIETLAAKLMEWAPSPRRIKAEGIYVMDKFLENASFEFTSSPSEIQSQRQLSIIIDVNKVDAGIYNLQVLGDAEPFELAVGENFIGNIPASNFEIDLSVNVMTSYLILTSRINLENLEGPEITASGKLKASLDNLAKIFDCFEIGCKVSEFSLEYEVNSQQEWLLGTSICPSNKCNLSSMAHNLKTSNTAEIFTIINESKILNPLYSIYFYALLSAGTKLDSGHEIKIN